MDHFYDHMRTGYMKGFIPSNGSRFADPFKKETYDAEVKRTIQDGSTHLTGRQVPSCLALTRIGTRIRTNQVSHLEEMGFDLYQLTTTGFWKLKPSSKPMASGISSATRGFLSSLLSRTVGDELSHREGLGPAYFGFEGIDSDSSDSDDEVVGLPLNTHRFKYRDPFRANCAVMMARITGNRNFKVFNWPGAVKRLTDDIPVRALGPNWSGNAKRSIPLHKIADPNVILHVLLNHTHWGLKLQRTMKDRENKMYTTARNLKRRIKSFIFGKPDPSVRKGLRETLMNPPEKEGLVRKRVLRFLQMLQTVDGIFTQIYLADPYAGWTWEVFDTLTLRNIDLLLTDEFLDGELHSTSPLTNYERLKQFRGRMKEAILNKRDLPPTEGGIEAPYAGIIEFLNSKDTDSSEWLEATAILAQTRGCGTPPPIVVLKSKEKFLKTIGTRPPPLEKGREALIRMITQKIVNQIPDHVFTGLSTKAGIHITGSACLEETRETGGTSEAIRKLVNEGRDGRGVRIVDLNTGSHVGFKDLSELTEGEYIFWRCLEEVLACKPKELRKASLVMIREPGKARTVTKARAALKVILDVVNSICSYPLKKGIESSESGMGKAHHGWNFFKKFYQSWRNLTFSTLESKRTDGTRSSFTETKVYHDLFVGCTDYSEATDNLDHGVARVIADIWMSKCGIPDLLRGIIHETCFKPRTILFNAYGVLKKIGTPVGSDETERQVTLYRGVLMGDPLTKVILHLVNIGVRELMRIGTPESVLQLHPGCDRLMPIVSELY